MPSTRENDQIRRDITDLRALDCVRPNWRASTRRTIWAGLTMDRQALQDAAATLRGLPFPPSPVDPDLGDWIMDLVEADTYYAGLAQSALVGAPFSRPPENSLAELAEWLDELRVPTPDDEVILDSCRTYLVALTALHEALRS